MIYFLVKGVHNNPLLENKSSDDIFKNISLNTSKRGRGRPRKKNNLNL